MQNIVVLINKKKYNIFDAINKLENYELDYIAIKNLLESPNISTNNSTKYEIGDNLFLYVKGYGVMAVLKIIDQATYGIQNEFFSEIDMDFWEGEAFEEACKQCENKFVIAELKHKSRSKNEFTHSWLKKNALCLKNDRIPFQISSKAVEKILNNLE